MDKKPRSKTTADDKSNSRKETCSPDLLRKIAERLRGQASEFMAVAAAMEKSGVESIAVDGYGMLGRAMAQIDVFIATGNKEFAIEKKRKAFT
ncbi:MAG TPA: hypothetical protein VG713_08855 [Pirellulales bacterium]|nr:hypothetical protein [Pirellulales bacterium]